MVKSLSDFLLEAFSAVSGAEFDEKPVEIEEFVTSADFLKLPPLSEYQYQIVRAASQIYKEETLIALYGEEKGRARFKETYNEVVLMLGKGSGKDHCSVIAVCYIVYLLLCLKNPSAYYDQPDDEPIDIINVAINAEQARTVFFNRFRGRIETCPWFIGKYTTGNSVIDFDKNIHAYSGHSQREAFEGKNLIVAILDEISAFALESNTGNDLADTAHATYQMYKDSVTSRYAEFGKVVLLSFPRFYGDYIMQRYGPEFNDKDKGIVGAVAEKETVERHHTFKLNNDLPDGIEENEFTITWEEDHITRYVFDNVWALRRPSWEVNPTKNIEMYKHAFYSDYANALTKFACKPSDHNETSFFKNKVAIEEAFIAQNGVDNEGYFHNNFRPKKDMEYYVHVDLSKVHDRCAVALAHVEKWVLPKDGLGDPQPVVRVDAVRWWKPSKDMPMDYKAVIKFIMDLKKRGFDIKLVTFDRWNSIDTMNSLNDLHIETDTLSVEKKHYDDFLYCMYDERLIGPRIEELVTELRELRRMMKGEKIIVDHPRSGFKDLSDAVCGAIFNAIEQTPKPQNKVVEVVSYKSLMKKQRLEERAQAAEAQGVIKPPQKRPMPENLQRELHEVSLEQIKLI